MAELEAGFNAPIIEAYGMTEAAHQMTSNPLPPAKRKLGSVGIAATRKFIYSIQPSRRKQFSIGHKKFGKNLSDTCSYIG